jgi:hypothetical protein
MGSLDDKNTMISESSTKAAPPLDHDVEDYNDYK